MKNILLLIVLISFIFLIENILIFESFNLNTVPAYAMGNGGMGGGNNGNNGQGGGNANAGGNNPNARGNNPKAIANKNKNKVTPVKSSSKRKGKSVYTPKFYHTIRLRPFESDWITWDIDGLAYSNNPNSRNRFGEVRSTLTFNLHKLWERNRRNKKIRENNEEMKKNLDYAVEHYKFIQQEDGSWLIKEK